MASSTVLQEKPEVRRAKIEWLRRHDQECGGLYGILPICLSLPVRATEHLDRRRGILKGCKGKIIGWSTAPGTQIWNTLPEVIYVQFETSKTWRIEGLRHDTTFTPLHRNVNLGFWIAVERTHGYALADANFHWLPGSPSRHTSRKAKLCGTVSLRTSTSVATPALSQPTWQQPASLDVISC